MSQPEAGDAAPAFKAEDETGKVWTLDDLKGRWTVLYFYPRDDTPGCTKEACAFQENLDALADADAIVLGVSRDDAKSHAKFKDKFDLTFPLLVDEGDLTEAYGVWVQKKMYGREFMGIQRATFLIDPEGTIAHTWPKVRPKGHAEDVLTKLQDLQQA